MPGTDPEILFAWAHLADTQFRGPAGEASHRLVLAELRNDLAALAKRGGPKLDAILVTGDVAYAGAEDQYAEASKWLVEVVTAAGLPAKSVYVVPGNHDVDGIAAREREVARLVGSLREGREPLDDALAQEREPLLRPQAHYLKFAAGLAPVCKDPYWVESIGARGGLRVRLVGLDTALLSDAGPNDRGKLRIGNAQLARGLEDPGPDELIVVLSHHPFRDGWLERADQKNADGWVASHAHLHLFAHVGEHASEQSRSGAGGTFVRVSAGIVYAGGAGQDGHGYNVAAVLRAADGTLSLRLWPRRWRDRQKTFRPDDDALPEVATHVDHPLRLVLPRAAAAPVVAAPRVAAPSPAPATAVVSASRAGAGSFTFPPPLVEAYQQGKLAVLFGSGLSMARDVKGDFPRWNDLPERLIDQAVKQGVWTPAKAEAMRTFFKSDHMPLEGMLTALDMIKQPLRGGRRYRQALTALFRPTSAAPGDVHQAIVDLGAGVLLTTNYDELLEAVEGPPKRRVYTWLQSDKALDDIDGRRKILFKIHGSAEDDDSIVMTRAEYEKAAADVPYQRTMSLLLQSYTFLLVGYGINDPLDLDLVFGLNTRAFGSAARTHYALVKDAAPNDRDRWQRELNVQVVPYDDHGALPSILRSLLPHDPP